MLERLKALAVFAAVVDRGSFRGAARALGLSPSVVSHHVGALERSLGQALLYRSTRRLALTPQGEALHGQARAMVDAAARGLDAAGAGAGEPSGALRVTAPALLAETAFCRDVAGFASAFPKVALSLSFTEERRDLLRDGLDLALRIGWPEDSALKARRLAAMPRVLVAAPAYVAARPKPGRLGDLAGWDWIHLTAVRPEAALMPPGGGTAEVLPYIPRVAVDSATAMRAMTVAGLGVATLPEVLARQDLARGRLVRVLPRWRSPMPGVYALWPGGTPRPGLTMRFVDFMAPRLAALFRASGAGRAAARGG
ncbi:MAG: LysR family transcriptional regulator [Alphaproteobacteria bacterium]|nr:LysR family transcriptional regulator [Alphaproteobacteria bacterium]